MARILIVEDETALSGVLRADLEAEGHTVCQAFDGPSALALVESQQPQLVILDWMLPGLDGLSVCRRIRERHLMPILMLTARASEVDRVLGLEVGADDYVVKPFSTQELLARVRALLRRIELDRLAQVILNLARNAITYTPAGGIVALDVTHGAQPDTLEVSVTDTGMGIPDDDLPHSFERFYRSDASRARHSGGFGLGLSITRDLVKAMGGGVTAERMAQGGSRFIVTLPVARR